MGINKNIPSRLSRNSPRASASLLGLAAGAVGWSGLAQAASEETNSQMMLLPEHYELMKNGVVVFKLETGENLSLTADQYLILEDGLLLITDELAQASIYSLPVMGSVRAQLLSDLEQVATIDGTVAEATPAQTLSITEGQAPRLSEQVDLQSYEVAQSSDVGADEDGGLLPLGLSGGAGFMLLAGLMTSDQPEAETPESPAPPAPPAPPAEPEFWTDADVADSASTAITGSSANSFVGYTAASTTATTDSLTAVGKGSGSVATFDMSAGGNNYFVAADHAGASSGSISYTGGSGDDSLTFGKNLASQGNATFDMRAGGNNTLVVEDSATAAFWTAHGSSGSLSYTGGAGNDNITINGAGLGVGGTATFDMSAGGNNTFVTGDSAASSNISFVYTGGSGTDSLTFGADFAYSGTAVLDMSAGGNNIFVAGDDVGKNGSFRYTGGTGDESLTFGGPRCAWDNGNVTIDMTLGGDNTLLVGTYAAAATNTVYYDGGVMTYQGGMGVDNLTFGANAAASQGVLDISLGDDAASETITFQGSVGADDAATASGIALIKDFDPSTDTIRLEAVALTSSLELEGFGGGVMVTSNTATTVKVAITGVTTSQLSLSVVSGAVEIG